MNNSVKETQTVTASVNAEDFHEQKTKRKEILKPFAVQCPICDKKTIIDSKKATKYKRANCPTCHEIRNLRYVASVIRFGNRGQYFKLRWIQE